ncbi:hypothetical protein NP493_23g03018 [Ridgeia piscesae]|uniref:Uncharacterized protein n=1 Tax=Ridgeia piscesae TaxID=27915 RepID=A0AAD9PDD2_RIDPI|nr:hypothetical protein NP493_23g03018 [Ridgeia piscesae]
MTSSQWSLPRDLARRAVFRLKKLPPPLPIFPCFLPLGTFSLSDWFCANAICSDLFLFGITPWIVSWLFRPSKMARHEPTTPPHSVSVTLKMAPLLNAISACSVCS